MSKSEKIEKFTKNIDEFFSVIDKIDLNILKDINSIEENLKKIN